MGRSSRGEGGTPPRPLDDADEHVLERIRFPPGFDDADAGRLEPADRRAPAGLDVAVDDHVEAAAEERDPPALALALEEVRRALGLVHDELEEVSRLAALDGARSALGHQLAGR